MNLHPKFNKVYNGMTIVEIKGTIANSSFPINTKVQVAIGISESSMGYFAMEEVKKWRSNCGGQWVMCEDVQDDINWAEIVMKNDDYYSVWVIDEAGKRDFQCDLKEASKYIKLDGTYKVGANPEKIVEQVCYLHNKRVD